MTLLMKTCTIPKWFQFFLKLDNSTNLNEAEESSVSVSPVLISLTYYSSPSRGLYNDDTLQLWIKSTSGERIETTACFQAVLHWDGFAPPPSVSQISLKKLFCALICISFVFSCNRWRESRIERTMIKPWFIVNWISFRWNVLVMPSTHSIDRDGWNEGEARI